MINYGSFGASDAFDALVYGQTHPSTVQFLQNQVSSVVDTLTDAGRSFMGKAAEVFDRYNSSEAMRFAREVMASVKGAFQTPRIVSLWDLAEMQDASVMMQRWIMANPNVRAMYHNQRCDGYSDTYVDFSPGEVGVDHYDYRRVMDGMVVFGEDFDWKATIFLDELYEGDRDLIHDEKIDIINTWSAMDVIMALGRDDPTSSVGGSL
jgi:hypothetical protein